MNNADFVNTVARFQRTQRLTRSPISGNSISAMPDYFRAIFTTAQAAIAHTVQAENNPATRTRTRIGNTQIMLAEDADNTTRNTSLTLLEGLERIHEEARYTATPLVRVQCVFCMVIINGHSMQACPQCGERRAMNTVPADDNYPISEGYE